MNPELEKVFPFVNPWAIEKTGDESPMLKETEMIWSDGCIDVYLYLNEFNLPMLEVTNVEIKTIPIFTIPVKSESNFLQLIKLLEE